MNYKKKFHALFIRSLRVDILTAFLGLILISTISIISFSYNRDSKMILSFAEDFMEKTSEVTVNKTTDLLNDAQKTSQIGAQLINYATDVSLSNEDLLDFMFAVLMYNPYFDNYYFGTINGTFLMVSRLPPDRSTLPENPPANSYFRLRFIDRNVTPATDTLIYYDANGKKIETVHKKNPTYDPRDRPWFIKEAKSQEWSTMYNLGSRDFEFLKKQSLWTAVYNFEFTDQEGVSVSNPAFTESGVFLGNFGTDLSLQDISKYLRQQQIGRGGMAIIMTEEGKIIASANLKEEKKRLGKNVQPTVFNIKDTRFKAAYDAHQKNKLDYFPFESGGTTYLASYNPFPIEFVKNWIVFITVPSKDFLETVMKNHTLVLLISIGILILSIIAAIFLARKIAKPIMQLAKEIDEIRNFNLDSPIDIRSNIKEIIQISDATKSMQSAIRSFSYFVPKELVKKLITQGVDLGLGGQSKRLAMFFSDIQDFTNISEGRAPEELMVYLSKYLDEISRIIIEEKGTIDKYIGDNVMAFWGAPEEDYESSFHCCRAALLCVKRIDKLNEEWKKEGKPSFVTRIGLHKSDVVVGNIGTHERRNYTIIGDGVNLTSRLESLNKFYQSQIIVSEEMYSEVKQQFLARPLDIVAVKGKKTQTKLYELLGQYNAEPEITPSEEEIAFCKEFTIAHDLYFDRKFEAAKQNFEALLKKHPHDGPSKYYLEHCIQCINHPPSSDWKGIRKMDLK